MYPDRYIFPLAFAWENKEERMKLIKEYTKATQVLIIIGYSMPDLNRLIDMEIIRNMENLREIYIQDLKASELESQLKNHLEIYDQYEFTQIIQTDKFYIPTGFILG